jgi:hypothetical protein
MVRVGVKVNIEMKYIKLLYLKGLFDEEPAIAPPLYRISDNLHS